MATDFPESSPEPPSEPTPDGALELQRQMADALRKKLPDEPIQPEKLASVIAQVLSVEIREIAEFRGPLPPPKMLREYEEVLPGLAGRIADRADKEQIFRHSATDYAQKTERRELNIRAVSIILGQVFGFIIGMTAVGGGVYLLAVGRDTGGLVTIITGLTALVAVFIGGKLLQQKEQRGSEEAESE